MLVSSQHRHDKIDGTVYKIVHQPPVHKTSELKRKGTKTYEWGEEGDI